MHSNAFGIDSSKIWRTKDSVVPSQPWRRPLLHHVDTGRGLLHFRCLFQAEKHQRQDVPQQHHLSVLWYSNMMTHYYSYQWQSVKGLFHFCVIAGGGSTKEPVQPGATHGRSCFAKSASRLQKSLKGKRRVTRQLC